MQHAALPDLPTATHPPEIEKRLGVGEQRIGGWNNVRIL
jgi:hypothetical protein